MKWWNRLSYRLTFFILLIAVVPLTGFGIATLKDIKHVRLKSEEKLHESALKNAASRIESYLTETTDKIKLVIESSELDGLDTFDQEWQMQIMIKDIRYLHSISILDLKGTETVKVCRERLYQKNDLITRSDLPDFTSDQENMPFWGNLVRLKNNRLVLNLYLLLLSPVERHIRGILNAEIDVEKMLSFISDMRIGDTGYLYLVDDQGKILIHPDRSVVLAGKDARHNPLVKAFVSGSNVFPVNQRFEDLKGIISLTNGQLVENPRFLVVAVHSEEEITAAVSRIITRQSSILAVTLAVALSLSLMFTLKFNRTMRLLEAGARRIGSGEFNHRVKLTSSNELGSLANSFNAMAGELQRIKEVNDQQDWIKKGIINLDALLRGKSTLEDVCNGLISFIANYLNAKVGLIYVNNGKGTFQFVKGYAVHSGKTTPEAFQVGQGLPGQAALEKREIRLTDVPENYIRIVSGLGDVSPRFLTIIPLIYNDQVEAVLELGFLNELSELQHRYLEEAGSNMAIVIASARSREALLNALNQTQKQAEELQRQQEELQTANEEMEEQTQMLMVSESKLKEQQEELQAANEELEEKTDYLEQNKRNIEKRIKTLRN